MASSKRGQLSGSRRSLMASYAEALSRSTEALAMAQDEAYVSQPVSRRGSELVSLGYIIITLIYFIYHSYC